MSGVPFKLEINLQKLSVIAIAQKFWGSSIIREKIENFYAEEGYEGDADEFNTVTKEVLQQLDAVYLPEKVLVEIRDTIRLIGEKIYWWIYRVTLDLDLDFEYVEKIGWTCYGTVDGAKTFQLFWQNDSTLNTYTTHSKLLSDDYDYFLESLYSIACIFGQEKFVCSKLSTMRKILKDFCKPSLKIPASINKHTLISIWVCYYIGKSKEKGCQLYKNLDLKTNNPDAKLLLMCAKEGFFNAVKYFADNLKKGRDKHFYWTAEETLKKVKIFGYRKKNYDEYVEILIFLINGMSVMRKNLFLRQSLPDLFNLLIDIWPYQELILQMFNYTLDFMTEEDHIKLLSTFVDYFRSFREKDSTATNISHQIFQKLLEAASKEVKKDKIVDSKPLFNKLIIANDYSTLDVILNDPDISYYRDQIIMSGVEIFKIYVRNGSFKPVDEFIEEVLNTDDEKKEFKSNFNVLNELIEEKKFELSEKLVNWLADSNEEKMQLKREIDSLQTCREYYRKEKQPWVRHVKDFLNWQYDGDEELIKVVTIAFRTDEMIREEFCKIWSGNCVVSVESSKSKCSEFLNVFLSPEEIEIYKSEKLIENEEFIKLFCKYLLVPKHFETVDELLTFCNLSPDRIKKIKRKILDDIERWIISFGIDRNNFRMADAVVNWVVEDEEERKIVIGKFINSREGAELCCEVLNAWTENFFDDVVILLNFWVKPFGNILKIIDNCEGVLYSYDSRSKMRKFFEKLDKNEYLLRNDIAEFLPLRELYSYFY